MKLVTIPNVPLVETGDCILQSGAHTFTEEELAAAVAALGDPAVKKPRIGIDGLDDLFDPVDLHGGEPAFGHIENMRLNATGTQVLGDMVVPDFIADKLEWAYPARSIEGALGWESPQTGKRHELVITAVKLLGMDWPGSRTLPDLAEVLAAEDGESTEVESELVLAKSPASGTNLRAGLDVDLVRRRFADRIEAGEVDTPNGTTAWDLWVRSIRFDDSGQPYLKVQDEGSGNLYRIDFEVKGSDVTFGDFVEVVEQDVAVAAASDALRRPPLAIFASRDESRAVSATTNRQEDGSMNPDQIRRLRTAAGLSETELPDDASQQQIDAALDRLGDASAAGPTGENGGQGDPNTEPGAGSDVGQGGGANVEGDEPATTPAEQADQQTPEQVAARSAAIPEGMRLIDEGTLQQLQAGAKTATDLKADADRKDRDSVIAAAMGEGRFPPSSRERIERLWAADPDGTRHLLTASEADGGLAAGTVPVTERGEAPQEGDLAGDPGYPLEWLPPHARERVAAAAAGKPLDNGAGGVRIIREG